MTGQQPVIKQENRKRTYSNMGQHTPGHESFANQAMKTNAHSPSPSPMEHPNKTSKYLNLVDGLNQKPGRKLPGGKNNKIPIPRQTLNVSLSALMGDAMKQEPLELKLDLVLFGHHSRDMKVNRASPDDTFSKLKESQPYLDIYYNEEIEVLQSKTLDASNGALTLDFDNVVITYSSHNHGKSLILRYILYVNGQCVDHLDSYGFETITRRGIEKKNQKKRGAKDLTSICKVNQCVPNVGSYQGGALVEIRGDNFLPNLKKSCVVYFGSLSAPKIHSVTKTSIICTSPEHPQGTAQVTVSFGLGRLVETSAVYDFVDLRNPVGHSMLLQAYQPLDTQNYNMQYPPQMPSMPQPAQRPYPPQRRGSDANSGQYYYMDQHRVSPPAPMLPGVYPQKIPYQVPYVPMYSQVNMGA